MIRRLWGVPLPTSLRVSDQRLSPPPPVFCSLTAKLKLKKGSAVSIYGVFDFSSPSLIVLSFSIDGQAISQSFPVTTSSAQFVGEIGQEPNYPFHPFDFVPPGEHTLVVNLTTCINSTFRFDFLTYTPSFAKLSDMPADLGGSGNGGDSASSSSSGAGGNGNGHSVAVGAAVAVVVVVLLGVFVFTFLRRRRRSDSNKHTGTFYIYLFF